MDLRFQSSAILCLQRRRKHTLCLLWKMKQDLKTGDYLPAPKPYVGSIGIEEGKGQEEEGGRRNGLDEHQDLTQNEGTGSPNSQKSWNNNTKPHELFCRP